MPIDFSLLIITPLAAMPLLICLSAYWGVSPDFHFRLLFSLRLFSFPLVALFLSIIFFMRRAAFVCFLRDRLRHYYYFLIFSAAMLRFIFFAAMPFHYAAAAICHAAADDADMLRCALSARARVFMILFDHRV